jgi:hypothetical protein
MDPNNKKNISGAQFTQPSEEFQVRSASASVDFVQECVQPPAQTYVTVDDQIFISCCAMFNVNTVIATVRILTPSGIVMPLVFQVPSIGNRVVATKAFQLVEGYLLSVGLVALFPSTNVNPAYGSAMLVRTPFTGANASAMLASGYLNQAVPIGWPANSPKGQTEGPGFLTTAGGVAIATPAAGAEWQFVVPANMRVLVKSICAVLATAVTVANRNVKIVIDDGAAIYASITSGFSQVASLTNRYTWMDGSAAPVAFDNTVVIPLPSGLILPAGHRITSSTTALQAGDQWSAIVQLGTQWLDLS